MTYKHQVALKYLISKKFMMIYEKSSPDRSVEKYNTEIYYSIYLSLLNAPSLMYEIFPFIFLIAVKFFYLSLRDNKEMEVFKVILSLS